MDRSAEIELAKSAAPPSIADKATILVLTRHGYEAAVKGTNGFVCVVERSWMAQFDFPQFWNPHMRGPLCFNPAAMRSVLPYTIKRTEFVLAGDTKPEIIAAIKDGMKKHTLPPLEAGAMTYMMSKQQYLSDDNKCWHPHMKWFIPGDAAKSWGANLPGSPAIAANDPEDRMTIFLVWVGNWSDGTPRDMH